VARVVSGRSPWALLEPGAVDGSRHVPELKGTGPVTTTLFPDRVHIAAAPGVYAPQHDSHLLIDVWERMGRIEGRTAVDLCTGSGVVAIAAAQLGAAAVTARDVCPVAVQCARSNAAAAGVRAEILEGPLEDAIGYGPFDIVLSNPPYVPTPRVPRSSQSRQMPDRRGPGTPDQTGGWSSINFFVEHPACSPTAAPLRPPLWLPANATAAYRARAPIGRGTVGQCRLMASVVRTCFSPAGR
jgi:Ribosomal protein L11 methyltransferase (PrmA)